MNSWSSAGMSEDPLGGGLLSVSVCSVAFVLLLLPVRFIRLFSFFLLVTKG